MIRCADGTVVGRAALAQQDLESLHAGMTDFLIYAYSGTKIVKRRAFGAGGLPALREGLEPDNVNYCLLVYNAKTCTALLGRPVSTDVNCFVTFFPPGRWDFQDDGSARMLAGHFSALVDAYYDELDLLPFLALHFVHLGAEPPERCCEDVVRSEVEDEVLHGEGERKL